MDSLLVLSSGFLVGLEHSFEPDHIAAVTALNHEKNTGPINAAFHWSLGHTITLLFIAIITIFFNIVIPQNMTKIFELLIACLLVFLGCRLIYKASTPFQSVPTPKSENTSRNFFLVGIFHGLAGNAILILLIGTSLGNPIVSISYILIFGVGLVFGMSLLSVFIHNLKNIFNTKHLPLLIGSITVICGIIHLLNNVLGK